LGRNELRSSKEILEQLAKLDFRLAGRVPEKLMFAIVGGSAIRLLNPSYQEVTNDIDYILLRSYKNFDFTIFDEYLLNNRASIFEHHLPQNYQERLKEINIPFQNIKVFVLSPIDLIIMKLARSYPKDLHDIIKSEMIAKVDLLELTKEYEEIQQYLLGNEVSRYSIDFVYHKYLEFKTSGTLRL
jgi:hypothetical protein